MSRRPTPELTACLCGCGRQFRRSRSYALCAEANQRVRELIREIPLPTNFTDPVFARSGLVWGDREAVLALLSGDVAEAARRVAWRDEHPFEPVPDRAVVATR